MFKAFGINEDTKRAIAINDILQAAHPSESIPGVYCGTMENPDQEDVVDNSLALQAKPALHFVCSATYSTVQYLCRFFFPTLMR
jgi:hypothetical protein